MWVWLCAWDGKHGGEVAPHRGEQTTQLISQEELHWARQEEAVQLWEDKRRRVGGRSWVIDQGGITTKRYSDQLWDGPENTVGKVFRNWKDQVKRLALSVEGKFVCPNMNNSKATFYLT